MTLPFYLIIIGTLLFCIGVAIWGFSVYKNFFKQDADSFEVDDFKKTASSYVKAIVALIIFGVLGSVTTVVGIVMYVVNAFA